MVLSPPKCARLNVRPQRAVTDRHYLVVAYLTDSFQEAFEAERKDRLEREGRILKQLGEHEQEVALRFEQERVSVLN